MKKIDFLSNLVILPIDYLLLFAAGLTAYHLRFSEFVASRFPVFYEIPLSTYSSGLWLVALLGVIIFALNGFYTMHSKKLIKEIPKVFLGVSILIVFLILFIFLTRELFSSRFIIGFAWILAILYLVLARIILALLKNLFFNFGYGLSKIVIVGDKNSRQEILHEYQENRRLGFEVAAIADSPSQLYDSQTIQAQIAKKNIDYIVQTDSSISREEALDLLTFCNENHIGLKYVANLFQTQSLHLNLSSVAGLPLVEIEGTPLDGWGKVLKRLFDLLISFVLLVLLSPIFLVVATLIKLD
ncbi:hypothetical protein KBC40_03485 [Patescibacteria group bacterium]|nr:hypothetical protein [Patescibacteria group bacterium]